MKPYIICFMMSSVDGRIKQNNWGYKDPGRIYEAVASKIKSDGWIVGRVTMEEFSSKRPYRKRPGKFEVPKEDFIADYDTKTFAVAIDPHGKLSWDSNRVDTEHVISVLTERVSADYLDYLRSRNVSYIFGGRTSLDLKKVLGKLAAKFPIKVRTEKSCNAGGESPPSSEESLRSSERKDRMERSNQPPQTEGCWQEGDPPDLWFYRVKRPVRSVPRERREPQAGPASCLSDTASKGINASEVAVLISGLHTEAPAKGEGAADLPGSKSVARAEGKAGNSGSPGKACRTNYEGQAGEAAQRQEGSSREPGLRLVHSSQPQGQGPKAGEGANRSTQTAQATRAVRTTESDWQTFLRAIAEKADQDKHHRFGDLYRWLNQDVLRLSFYRLRKDAASGVDGVSFQEYEKNLGVNLADLEGRLVRKAYRARLVRRKYIPKGNGKLRPLGILVLEDKLLQMAATQILLAIYEGAFLPCSYGYRPGVRAHDAIQDLTQELQFGGHHFVVEADIKGFFDHVQWEWLEGMLERRIAEGAFMNLIGKWLRAGVLEEEGQVVHPQTGTPQGGIISPVLANIYLHYALDLWFERGVLPKQRGRCRMIRYADDFVACFEYRHEAQAFEKALPERLGKFGLEVAADKTQTLRFGRNGGPHNGRFDFLGFEFYWEPDRKGKPRVKRRTATKKHLAAMQRMRQWVKTHRHRKLPRLLKELKTKLQGTWN